MSVYPVLKLSPYESFGDSIAFGGLIGVVGLRGITKDNRFVETVWRITKEFQQMANGLDKDESATRRKSFQSCHDNFRGRHFELLWTYKEGLIEALLILEDLTQLPIEFLVEE